jgi:hypothetical protein
LQQVEVRSSSRRPRTQTGTDSAIGRIAAAHAQREAREKKKKQEEEQRQEKQQRARPSRKQQEEEESELAEEEEEAASGALLVHLALPASRLRTATAAGVCQPYRHHGSNVWLIGHQQNRTSSMDLISVTLTCTGYQPDDWLPLVATPPKAIPVPACYQLSYVTTEG